ncbi:MAG: serine kinase [Maritimibacter sp.]
MSGTASEAPNTGEARHASSVAIAGGAVLISGPSGSGKSSLALQLIALGARLIADDRTRLILRDGWPWALASERMQGVIEARGIGLLQTPYLAAAPLRLVVDMSEAETERLPAERSEIILGQAVPVIRRVDAAAFPSAIFALAKGGRWQDD